MKMHTWWLCCVATLCACAEDARRPGAALGSDDGSVPMHADAGAMHDGDASSAHDGSSDAGLHTPDAQVAHDAGLADAGGDDMCPPLHERTLVDVPAGVLPESLTHWTCDKLYTLQGIAFVHAADGQDPQVLTIDPGTTVFGSVNPSARGFLVVTRNGRIDAAGTAQHPIVFTSANPPGSRQREDWGGLTLLGAANTGGTRRAEGFPATVGGHNIDAYLAYGPRDAHGADAGPAPGEDAHDCGTLRYVRIEFASYNAGGGMGNESNALQLYACGYGTSIDFLHSHMSGDDGIEVFGGAVDFRHVVITGASDDSFDWDDGWHGRAQFLVAQQYDDTADLGFEAGGSSDVPEVAPNPRMFNMTWIGTNGAAVGKVGGRLRGASQGVLSNQLFLGFSAGALDIGGSSAGLNLRNGDLTVRHSVFWRAAASSDFPTGSDDTADDVDPSPELTDDIDEAVELTVSTLHNRVVDPALPAPVRRDMPGWAPAASAVLGAHDAEAPSDLAGDLRPGFFDRDARYIGAFEPGGSEWTRGWTSFSDR